LYRQNNPTYFNTPDLDHILLRYQEQEIDIFVNYGDGNASEKIIISKPSKFKSLMYRASVWAKLRRNPAGGFGGIIPDPWEESSGSSSGRIRRYGSMG